MYTKYMGALTPSVGGAPDYNTTLASGTNGSYEANDSCWFNVYGASNTYGSTTVSVNGVVVGRVSRSFTEETPAAHLLFLLKKGDRVTFSGGMSLSWRVFSTL